MGELVAPQVESVAIAQLLKLGNSPSTKANHRDPARIYIGIHIWKYIPIYIPTYISTYILTISAQIAAGD